jgi:hypothetical protein
MLKDARHLPRGRRHTGDGHYGLPIDFQNLVRTIVDDSVTRSRTAIPRNHVCCCVALCGIGPMAAGPSRPLRRISEGKSSAAPEKFWSNPNCERSITDPCAGDSAWIGWDRPGAFSLTDPLCPVAKRPANADHHRHLVLVPTEPVPPAFECAQA